MRKVTLKIETSRENQTVALEDELSVGRTDKANIVVDDIGLSRVNTTFFRDNDKFFVVDENSLNGTFLNGEKIDSEPKRLLDGDVIKIGSETRIRVEIEKETALGGSFQQAEKNIPPQKPKIEPKAANSKTQTPKAKSDKPPLVLIIAAASTFLIVFLALIIILIVKYHENAPGSNKSSQANKNSTLPLRLIDPLGGQTPQELQELADYWEVQEKDVDAADLADVTSSEPTNSKSPDASPDLKVSVGFWKQQRDKALEARSSPTGNDPPGQDIKVELRGDGVIKQKAKLTEMLRRNPPYQIPMDFADLAQKKMSGELIELPMATADYVLEVGGNAETGDFTAFNFAAGNVPIAPGSEKYNVLQRLANNFSGEKYDLNNPADRKQMRIRMLRMFHPKAKPILEEIARAYREKFNRPLRVTSLTRSMDYQISLNKNNPNSFKVRGAGSLPPHTSGCTFDLARRHMTAEEQNFVMAKLAEMERAGKLDALREGNLNACFHVFIYDDGIAPKM